MAGANRRRGRQVRSGETREQRRSHIDQPMDRSRGLRMEVDSENFGRISERVARYIGSWNFIAWMTAAIAAWVLWNIFAPAQWQPDPFPFIFLTLLLSLQASYAAPLILLAQNRQSDRDRVQYQEDRDRTERIVADAEYIAREIADLRASVGELATRDYLRHEMRELLVDLLATVDEDDLDRAREQVRDRSRHRGSGRHD